MCGDFVLITFLRMLFGFVEFEAIGGFPERFLNLCYINGITLWNVQNDGVKVKACTPIKAYRNIFDENYYTRYVLEKSVIQIPLPKAAEGFFTLFFIVFQSRWFEISVS